MRWIYHVANLLLVSLLIMPLLLLALPLVATLEGLHNLSNILIRKAKGVA